MTWAGVNEAAGDSLSSDAVESMLQSVDADYSIKSVPKNAVLFWEGERHKCHYFVIEGTVEIYALDSSGRKKTVDIYGPGSFFGYYILRDGDITMTTAQASTDCRVIIIPKGSYFKALRNCGDFAEATVRYLFGLLTMQTRESINSSFYVASQRVPMLLAELATSNKNDNVVDDNLVVTLGNNEIADMLGISRNSVNASIAQLQQMGTIVKQRGAIKIVDLEKLEQIAHFEENA
jgi:CRP/FNR family transcriptional regulator